MYKPIKKKEEERKKLDLMKNNRVDNCVTRKDRDRGGWEVR